MFSAADAPLRQDTGADGTPGREDSRDRERRNRRGDRDREHRDREHRDREHRDRDHRDRDHRDREHRDRDRERERDRPRSREASARAPGGTLPGLPALPAGAEQVSVSELCLFGLKVANDVGPYVGRAVEEALERHWTMSQNYMESEKIRTEKYEHSLEALQGDVKTVLEELVSLKSSVFNLHLKEDVELGTLERLAEERETMEMGQGGMRGPWAAGLQRDSIKQPALSQKVRSEVNAAAQGLGELHAKAVSDEAMGATSNGEDAKHGMADYAITSLHKVTEIEVEQEQELKQKASWLRKYIVPVVEHQRFMIMSTSVIAANAVEIAFTTNRAMTYVMANPGSGEPASLLVIDVLGLLFYGWYVLELLMKLLAYGKGFFTGPDHTWNIFDLFLILVSTFSQIEEIRSMTLTRPTRSDAGDIGQNNQSQANSPDMAWLRLLRMVKVLKVLRVVKAMRVFKELRLLMAAIQSSLSITLWALMVLMSTMFVFGIVFLQGLSGSIASGSIEISSERLERLERHFGSLYGCMITLFASVTQGLLWSQIYEEIKIAGVVYELLVVFFIAFSSFAVMNMIVGIGVDLAIKVAIKDSAAVNEIIAQNAALMRKFREIFAAVDIDSDGFVTLAEFQKVQESPQIKEFFDAIEIDVEDADHLFTLLARGQHHIVPVEEIIAGCMKLRGYAKSIDQVCLMSMNERLRSYVGTMFDQVDKRFNTIMETLELNNFAIVESSQREMPADNVPADDVGTLSCVSNGGKL